MTLPPAIYRLFQKREIREASVRRKANAKILSDRARDDNAVRSARSAARSRSVHLAGDDSRRGVRGRGGGGERGGGGGRGGGRGGEARGGGGRNVGGHSRVRSSPPGQASRWARERCIVDSVVDSAAAVAADGSRCRGGGGGGGGADTGGDVRKDRIQSQLPVGVGANFRSGRVAFGSTAAPTQATSRSRSVSHQRRQSEMARAGGGGGGVDVGSGGAGGVGVGGGCVGSGTRRSRNPSHPPPRRPSRSRSALLAEPAVGQTCEGESRQHTLGRRALDGGVSSGGVGRGGGIGDRGTGMDRRGGGSVATSRRRSVENKAATWDAREKEQQER